MSQQKKSGGADQPVDRCQVAWGHRTFPFLKISAPGDRCLKSDCWNNDRVDVSSESFCIYRVRLHPVEERVGMRIPHVLIGK